MNSIASRTRCPAHRSELHCGWLSARSGRQPPSSALAVPAAPSAPAAVRAVRVAPPPAAPTAAKTLAVPKAPSAPAAPTAYQQRELRAPRQSCPAAEGSLVSTPGSVVFLSPKLSAAAAAVVAVAVAAAAAPASAAAAAAQEQGLPACSGLPLLQTVVLAVTHYWPTPPVQAAASLLCQPSPAPGQDRSPVAHEAARAAPTLAPASAPEGTLGQPWPPALSQLAGASSYRRQVRGRLVAAGSGVAVAVTAEAVASEAWVTTREAAAATGVRGNRTPQSSPGAATPQATAMP